MAIRFGRGIRVAMAISVLGAVAAPLAWGAAIPVTAPSSDTRWTVLSNTGNSMDYFGDRQTGGNADGEIIGNGTFPGFQYSFWDGGTTTPASGANYNKDGAMTFRVRMSGDEGAAGFQKVVFVGMDLDLNGSLDMFVAADHQSTDRLGVFDGDSSKLNMGPSTAGVVNTPVTQWQKSVLGNTAYAQIFNWAPVYTIEGFASNAPGANIDSVKGVDYFVTFRIDFAAVVALATTKVPGFNDSSPVRFVLATSNSNSTLNLDLGGIDDSTVTSRDTRTWSDFGAFTPTFTSNPVPYRPPVETPEPGTMLLAGLGLAVLWRAGRISRRRLG